VLNNFSKISSSSSIMEKKIGLSPKEQNIIFQPKKEAATGG